MAEGVRRMGGNVAAYHGVLEKFRCNQASAIADIRAALEGGDRETAERLAHTLKGVSGALGAGGLQAQAGELEAAIREGRADMAALLPPLELALNGLFAAIDQALESRKNEMNNMPKQAGNAPDVAALAPLIARARAQLEAFDSGVEETVAQMRAAAGGDAATKAALDSLERCLGAYDYEQGLTGLDALAKEVAKPNAGA